MVDWFQFLIGKINPINAFAGTYDGGGFQFLIGKINPPAMFAVFSMLLVFQFLIGKINPKMRVQATGSGLSFNSS